MADLDAKEGDLAALRELVRSPGWTHLLAYANARWSAPHVVDALETAMLSDDGSEAKDLRRVRAMMAGRAAVRDLLAYPDTQIRHLERQVQIEAQRPVVPPRA